MVYRLEGRDKIIFKSDGWGRHARKKIIQKGEKIMRDPMPHRREKPGIVKERSETSGLKESKKERKGE